MKNSRKKANTLKLFKVMPLKDVEEESCGSVLSAVPLLDRCSR